MFTILAFKRCLSIKKTNRYEKNYASITFKSFSFNKLDSNKRLESAHHKFK